MKLESITDGLVVFAPAKLNLYFEVLGKRPDSFHEIETITTLIDLRDELKIIRTNRENGEIEFRCSDDSGNLLDLNIPNGQKNLVLKAVDLFRQKTGRRESISVELIKRIPTQAGLGGGSSDAAATLWGLDRICRTELTRAELQKMGAELGSDVPLFLVDSGIVWGRGRGENVCPLENIDETTFILLKPPQGLSTAAVYSHCDQTDSLVESAIPMNQAELAASMNPTKSANPMNQAELATSMNPAKSANLMKSIKSAESASNGSARRTIASILNESRTGLADDWRDRIFNRLETAAAKIWDDFAKIQKKMKLLPVSGVQMTGSGSCFFAICPESTDASRIAEILRQENLGSVWITKSVSN